MKAYLYLIITGFLIIGFSKKSNSQCEITAKATPISVCAGDSVELESTGSCGYLLKNDFNNNTIGSGWSSTNANPVFTNPCGPGPNGSYLWVGTTASNQRTLVTDTFDVAIGGCTIKWYMRYGIVPGSGSCEDPDAATEGVHLQYSTNFGATWTDFPGPNLEPQGVNSVNPPYITNIPGSGGYWQPHSALSAQQNSGLYYWHKYENNIPPVATTPNTMFRWAQLSNSSAGWDAWGIDEVEINCPTPLANVIWSTGDTVFDPGKIYLPPHPQNLPYDTCFIVNISDSLNPVGSFDTVCVHVKPIPETNFTLSDTAVCEYDSVNLIFTGNNLASAAYQWEIGPNTIMNEGPHRVSYIAGTYNVTLKVTQDGCVNTETKTLTFHQKPSANFTADKFKGCEPLEVNFTDDSSPAIDKWQWDFGSGYNSNQQHPTMNFDAGLYNVKLVVETDKGCKDSLIMNNIIDVYPTPHAQIAANPKITNIDHPDITFTSIGIMGGDKWVWNFGDGTTLDGSSKEVHTYNQAGDYRVMLILTSNKGCVDTAYIDVMVIVDELDIPNVITPNGDGYNDKFVIDNIDKLVSSQLIIYNRWGKKVYESNNYQNDWDGDNLSDGVYYYVLKYETYIESLELSGSVTIMRDK
jgi:gliding motility-associated-like protein